MSTCSRHPGAYRIGGVCGLCPVTPPSVTTRARVASRADQFEADRDRAQAVMQTEVDRVFVPGCLANVNNTVDVLALPVAGLIGQAREEGRREGAAEMVAHPNEAAAAYLRG